MNALSPADHHHLQAAEGWLGLGCPLEAGQELEQITPPLQAHPAVLALRLAFQTLAV